MKETKKVFITDCEGPISKNDNAFELTSHFIPEGEKFYTQISRYDDVMADIVKPEGYKAGDTLKIIVPFLKAYGVTNKKLTTFSARNVLLMPGAKDTLQFLKGKMPSFIISTSYEHYIRVLCRILDFPSQNAYCTLLNIDSYQIEREDQEKLKHLREEICLMPLIGIPERAKSLQDFSKRAQNAIKRLDEIFWREIMQMKSGKMVAEVNPVGGIEKAKATRKIVREHGVCLSDVIYVGDSITDVECFRLVRENGGLTICFNGNAYAVSEAEVAVLSTNAIVIAVIADVFNRLGKTSVHDLIDDFEQNKLEKHNLDSTVHEKLETVISETLPKVRKITPDTMKELAIESGAFRKLMRGEKVARLG